MPSFFQVESVQYASAFSQIPPTFSAVERVPFLVFPYTSLVITWLLSSLSWPLGVVSCFLLGRLLGPCHPCGDYFSSSEGGQRSSALFLSALTWPEVMLGPPLIPNCCPDPPLLNLATRSSGVIAFFSALDSLKPCLSDWRFFRPATLFFYGRFSRYWSTGASLLRLLVVALLPVLDPWVWLLRIIMYPCVLHLSCLSCPTSMLPTHVPPLCFSYALFALFFCSVNTQVLYSILVFFSFTRTERTFMINRWSHPFHDPPCNYPRPPLFLKLFSSAIPCPPMPPPSIISTLLLRRYPTFLSQRANTVIRSALHLVIPPALLRTRPNFFASDPSCDVVYPFFFFFSFIVFRVFCLKTNVDDSAPTSSRTLLVPHTLYSFSFTPPTLNLVLETCFSSTTSWQWN